MSDEIIVIDGWQLRRNVELFGDSEPRILDVDAAKRVQLTRPRDIRKIIEPLARPENLSDFGICAVTAQNHSGGRGRPTREYWLTETQLIIVIGRCETPVAFKIQCEVARVFVAWRRGHLSQPTATALDPGVVRAMFQAEFEKWRSEVCGTFAWTPTGCITPGQCRYLRNAVTKLARAMVDAGTAKNLTAARRTIDNVLTSHIGWGGRAKPWSQLPFVQLPEAHFVLRELTVQLDKTHPAHKRKSTRRQLSLVSPLGPGDRNEGHDAGGS